MIVAGLCCFGEIWTKLLLNVLYDQLIASHCSTRLVENKSALLFFGVIFMAQVVLFYLSAHFVQCTIELSANKYGTNGKIFF